uniref:Small ribosomal subunit protein bS1c n=1 Tax=Caloglossa intermedia TaxID=100879 RepID=A0A1Z1M628_9FLOR|nr:ribosomal protein S1 [Caloglossa intermedia]ARW61547.1 ribosomal protein S1 [Caloglossa intermedia]
MANKKQNRFLSILKQYKYNLHSGDIVAGTINYEESQGFLVNIGDKISGYLPKEEIQIEFILNHFNYRKLVNTTREFFIVKYNIKIRQYILSIKRLTYIRGWNRIKQLRLIDAIFNLPVRRANKGGLIVYLEGIQGFIPNSHITLDNKRELYKKIIDCKILIANEKRNQLILSNKNALLALSFHKFKIGEIVYGTISKIKDYGLFIKVYNITALLHISEIGFIYIKDISKIFNIGQLIKIKIIHVDARQGRISASRRSIKNI